MSAWRGPQRVLLGVSGGIAAYKACELVRRLREREVEVRVVLTANAERFVGALTFQALSGQPVRNSLWDAAAEAAMGHIELARWADVVLVAPASANTLARLAHGLADDLLGTLCLASDRPLLLAPAMNRLMWAHPATQANLALLQARGAQILGPDSGTQACGEVGAGRMLEPDAIVTALAELAPAVAAVDLHGLRVLISAGPTLEDLDPVRYLGNRSSGRMGFAIAAAAAQAGAEVTLVAGPVSLATPPGLARRVDVRSARQMHAAMLDAARAADIVIAAAAVADYRPAQVSAHKIKKHGGALTMELLENPDILAALAALRPKPFLVGFAAETEQLEAHARAKLERKGADMIAANRVDAGLGIETADNALRVFWHGGQHELARTDKVTLARELLVLIATRRAAARAAAP
ncbi:MAG: bifunctional phosphopantothenoylcysteine decarboxylase/phosphopantothenate--cysteine ligase CoaBC [Metallibacterium scheffleri]|uniref:bifunctional phosphopantothenoylcysteine decarboxylase/phosphopantothenate--cysteine ligase CoaBC n=1 Tax=Metallibacterium scheffleri TaxID=993689 RepID=UPI0026EC079E|nr:bifunctional phosphopantothenoylcysteine decarboxylase/phosphopantothenate--cysteine ligase CoaBC [Metallibacterium scheffleri]MCK9366431.1 bifunctional phosphopantothenoylcysteine decarboxylase/phosphopantothenate--cysteine ligase CoaBC [Metallibacterium scheffleri]